MTRSRNLANRATDFVSVTDFGAVEDGVTDDTAAVQAAITYALANNAGLLVVGLCYITSSLIVNRLVNAQTNEFVIRGAGTRSGFLAAAGVTLFDSTLVGTPPQSDYVKFDGIHFEAAVVANANTYVMSKNFLRVMFTGCNFYKIKCVNSNTYLESWYWSNNTVESWQAGWFINCAGCYDVSIIGNCVEGMSAGGSTAGFFQSYDSTATLGAYGLRIIGNLIEGCAGSAISVDGSRGVTIKGNYFEGNGDLTHQCIKLDTGTISHNGLEISSNFFGANPNYPTAYNIRWYTTLNATSCNNFSLSYLHDNSAVSSANLNVSSFNDQANTTLWATARGNGISALTFGQGTGVGSITGAQAVHAEQFNYFQFLVTNATTASLAAPTGGVNGQEITVQIWNNVAGSVPITAFGYAAIYKAPTWTNLAAGFSRWQKFMFDGANWRCSSSFDAPN